MDLYSVDVMLAMAFVSVLLAVAAMVIGIARDLGWFKAYVKREIGLKAYYAGTIPNFTWLGTSMMLVGFAAGFLYARVWIGSFLNAKLPDSAQVDTQLLDIPSYWLLVPVIVGLLLLAVGVAGRIVRWNHRADRKTALLFAKDEAAMAAWSRAPRRAPFIVHHDEPVHSVSPRNDIAIMGKLSGKRR